jgi:hypothetical protein
MSDKGGHINNICLAIAGICMIPLAGCMIIGAATNTLWLLPVGGAFLGVIVVCAIIGMIAELM